MGGSCHNLGPQAIGKTLRETILTLVALWASVLPFWEVLEWHSGKTNLILLYQTLAKGQLHFTGQGGLCHTSQLCTAEPQLSASASNRDTAGTGGIANTWKNEAGGDLQRKACKENACPCLNFWVVFVLSPSRCSLNWGTAAFPSLQSNSLVARAGTAWSAKQLKHQHLYSDCSDRSNPHAGHETGKKLKLITHVGHGPI